MIVRPYLGCDASSILDIEIKSYYEPWEWEEFEKFGRSISVCVVDGRVVGYACMKGNKLLRLAVKEEWRRMGAGTLLLNAVRGTKCSIIVCETNFAQFFLRENGFKCVNIIKGAFTEYGDSLSGLYFLWRQGLC